MHNSKIQKDIIRHIEESVCKCFRDAGIRNVLVGVSGGADSVALLHACTRIATRIGLHIEAVNCNFHLRGDESDRDSDFTERLCKRLGVTLHRLDYDVAAYMHEHPGISKEMACRDLRYADFFRLCEERGLDRVAVAHNADDDIETMMLNLIRGSGTRGLRGMDHDNGRVIRPILGVSRTEIESYLKAIGQAFITDSSNLTSHYRRNFIRLDVIPLLENRWPGARKSLARTISIMKEESEIINDYYHCQLSELTPDPYTLLVYADKVRTGTVLRFIEPFGGNSAIAEEIMECRGRRYGGRRWKLSDTHDAELERDKLVIIDNEAECSEPLIQWTELDMTQDLMAEIKRNGSHEIVYLPQDAKAYEIRPPRTGDRMAPLGMKGSRLISDIISDARLSSAEKARTKVLARKTDGEIIWVTGLKRSRHELVDPDARCVYRACYRIKT